MFVTQRRRLIVNDSLTVNQHELGNHESIGKTETHESGHLVALCISYRKSDLELIRKVLHKLTSLLLGAAFIQDIDCHIEGLEAAIAVFVLEVGHYF